MFDVNIYIETDNKSPGARGGKYGYMLEYILKDGTAYTKAGCGCSKDATGKRLALLALAAALARIEKRSRITVYTDCSYLASAFRADWIGAWKQNSWMTAKKKEVKNRDIWEEISARQKDCRISIVTAPKHTYSSIMLMEMGHARAEDGETVRLKALEVKERLYSGAHGGGRK